MADDSGYSYKDFVEKPDDPAAAAAAPAASGYSYKQFVEPEEQPPPPSIPDDTAPRTIAQLQEGLKHGLPPPPVESGFLAGVANAPFVAAGVPHAIDYVATKARNAVAGLSDQPAVDHWLWDQPSAEEWRSRAAHGLVKEGTPDWIKSFLVSTGRQAGYQPTTELGQLTKEGTTGATLGVLGGPVGMIAGAGSGVGTELMHQGIENYAPGLKPVELPLDILASILGGRFTTGATRFAVSPNAAAAARSAADAEHADAIDRLAAQGIHPTPGQTLNDENVLAREGNAGVGKPIASQQAQETATAAFRHAGVQDPAWSAGEYLARKAQLGQKYTPRILANELKQQPLGMSAGQQRDLDQLATDAERLPQIPAARHLGLRDLWGGVKGLAPAGAAFGINRGLEHLGLPSVPEPVMNMGMAALGLRGLEHAIPNAGSYLIPFANTGRRLMMTSPGLRQLYNARGTNALMYSPWYQGMPNALARPVTSGVMAGQLTGNQQQ